MMDFGRNTLAWAFLLATCWVLSVENGWVRILTGSRQPDAEAGAELLHTNEKLRFKE